MLSCLVAVFCFSFIVASDNDRYNPFTGTDSKANIFEGSKGEIHARIAYGRMLNRVPSLDCSVKIVDNVVFITARLSKRNAGIMSAFFSPTGECVFQKPSDTFKVFLHCLDTSIYQVSVTDDSVVVAELDSSYNVLSQIGAKRIPRHSIGLIVDYWSDKRFSGELKKTILEYMPGEFKYLEIECGFYGNMTISKESDVYLVNRGGLSERIFFFTYPDTLQDVEPHLIDISSKLRQRMVRIAYIIGPV